MPDGEFLLPDFGLLPVGPDLIESYNPATGECRG